MWPCCLKLWSKLTDSDLTFNRFLLTQFLKMAFGRFGVVAVAVLVLTALALLVARGSAPRRTEILYAPLVQLTDTQEGDADAGEGSAGDEVRFLPYLPKDLSEGTAKKMATMDRMVLGWNAKKDPREFARDYSADTDRCRGCPGVSSFYGVSCGSLDAGVLCVRQVDQSGQLHQVFVVRGSRN